MSRPASAAPARSLARRPVLLGLAAVAAVVTASLWAASRPEPAKPGPEKPAAAAPAAEADEAGPADSVSLPRESWDVAGVRVAPAEAGPLADVVRVTGKVALNEDRVAHVFPLVEGRVEEVKVRFGQEVKAGDVLAVIHSKEVGQRKLELVQSRLAREIASLNRDRAAEVERNTLELVESLEAGDTVDRIETRFRGRPMGEFRERLVTAYAGLAKAAADYDRIDDLTGRGVTAAKDLTAAKAARDGARATFAALLDQSKFDARQQAATAGHALREADARVAAGEAALAILGYSPEDLARIEPAKEGEALSHYMVVAPFDGTILTKDAVLLESVGPDRQLFQIADLSSVWVVADVFERHLPALAGLEGKAVAVRSEMLPGPATGATVFFTGETVEEATRTVRVRAVAENPDRRLKPGLFVEVELPGLASGPVVQVPEAAVVDHEGESFVFVREGEETFRRRDVTLGRRADGKVEIASGLKPGEPVVVGGAFALKSKLLADLLAGD